MSSAAMGDLERFVRGDCDPANFPHREHVRMAFEMLCRHSFTETALQVGLGPDGSLATVGLATATVGPNGGLEAVPVVNAESAGIAGGALALGLAVLGAALIRRRRTAQVPA